MKPRLKLSYRLIFSLIIFLFTAGLFSDKSYAATLTAVKDTVTTSRPSASAPLQADQAAAAAQVTIFDNKSFYLASDSAILQVDTGQTQNTVNVASMSAAGTPASGQRVVYFTNTAANTHHAGTAMIVPVTAMHTVQFTTQTAIPASGKIVIAFPGSGLNTASPSATTFSFNSLASGQISYKLDGTRTCTFTISAPNITCTVDAGGAVAGGTTITFLIGCADGSSNETTCTTQAPRLINPTKTAAGGQGAATTTADSWKIAIQTQDSTSVLLDSANAAVGTIEPVIVTANVDPTLTFTIAGIADATAINNGNTTGCTNSELTNSGTGASGTNVNLGTVSSATIRISAQTITVSTNAVNGYSLTATSSGHLINVANGNWITDSTTPTVMTAGTSWFGIHPCGLDVTAGTWGTGATGGGAGAKYAWPTQTTSVSLATKTSGPVGSPNPGPTGSGIVSMEYAATVDVTVPAGTYQTYVTYVATPTF